MNSLKNKCAGRRNDSLTQDAGVYVITEGGCTVAACPIERYHSRIAMTGDVHERASYSFNAVQSRRGMRL